MTRQPSSSAVRGQAVDQELCVALEEKHADSFMEMLRGAALEEPVGVC